MTYSPYNKHRESSVIVKDRKPGSKEQKKEAIKSKELNKKESLKPDEPEWVLKAKQEQEKARELISYIPFCLELTFQRSDYFLNTEKDRYTYLSFQTETDKLAYLKHKIKEKFLEVGVIKFLDPDNVMGELFVFDIKEIRLNTFNFSISLPSVLLDALAARINYPYKFQDEKDKKMVELFQNINAVATDIHCHIGSKK